jgi:hypothetical protein
MQEETQNKIENEVNVDTLLTSIDFSSINYEEFEIPDQEQIDLYYELNNDSRDNIEFFSEDLLAYSKSEDEKRNSANKAREEFDFQMEALVEDDNPVKVDLTEILEELKKFDETNNKH